MPYKFRVKLRLPNDEAVYEYYEDYLDVISGIDSAIKDGCIVEECYLVERTKFSEWADKYMPSILIGLLLAAMGVLALWPGQ